MDFEACAGFEVNSLPTTTLKNNEKSSHVNKGRSGCAVRPRPQRKADVVAGELLARIKDLQRKVELREEIIAINEQLIGELQNSEANIRRSPRATTRK